MQKMTPQTKVALVFAVVVVAIFGGAIGYQVLASSEPVDATESASIAAREDSHRLSTAGDDKVTLVEFLDFECEGCLAAYPFVEQLREQFEGQVTFVVRYFPVDSHANARSSAHAVEAAARQGKFEQMYERMYETQTTWGESSESKAPLFRSFAEDLGLDMAAFDADVASDAVAERVQEDVDDGTLLGVRGTPTFFLNGQRLTPSSTEEFVQAIEAALAE